LAHEFTLRNIPFQQQKQLFINYKGLKLNDCPYRMDFFVANSIVVEIKAVEKIIPVHHAQILSQMKLGPHKLGLLINFNVPLLLYFRRFF
jgi:GxxExxY protein